MTEPLVIDLHFRDQPRVIATGVIRAPEGLVLVDPGPASCLPALERGLRALGHSLEDVRALLLTHIHLDHAGATGALAARLPGLRVYVHARGAPHMVHPEKLLASATRLYGDAMDRLWGPFLPTPEGDVTVLNGGERIDVAGRALTVAYTPGHAVHHVSYLDEETGLAYVGDTAGIRVSAGYLIAPTPPPDIDLERWEESLQALEAWRPSGLFLTHFGAVSPVGDHLARFREALAGAAATVQATLTLDGDDDEKMAAFADRLRADVSSAMPPEEARATELAAPFGQLWQGLARYYRKRAAG
ncbi:MAG: MBL fold metallo-hydrolase [Vicinamibacterales bacterium]|nr:MBL fold metallo-hydrolase [Vicinamibacterales bacterium]